MFIDAGESLFKFDTGKSTPEIWDIKILSHWNKLMFFSASTKLSGIFISGGQNNINLLLTNKKSCDTGSFTLSKMI